MSIGYDASKVPAPTSVADLLKPDYKGKVALNGDPTQAGAAWNGVMMASLANGGSLDDISKGVDFFKQLNDAGNFLPVDPTPATIESGQTPVVIDWDYLQAGQVAALKEKGIDWKIVVPENAVLGGYYFQAINKDAPHPACARLWQEYLYSDEGQNGWLPAEHDRFGPTPWWRPARSTRLPTQPAADHGHPAGARRPTRSRPAASTSRPTGQPPSVADRTQ